MNILHLGRYYPPEPSDASRFLQDLARAQAAAGHSVRVLIHRGKTKSKSDVETDRGVEVVRAGLLGHALDHPVSHAYPLLLKRHGREPSLDLVHAHLPNPSAFWALRCDAPLVVHWHADVFPPEDRYLRLGMPLLRTLERRMLDKARIIVATSRTYMDASKSLAPYRHKCVVVPLGLDTNRLQAGQKPSPPLRRDRPLVLAAGRFLPHKGYAHMIKAAAAIPNAEVVLAGGGPLLEEMRERVRHKGLSERVRLPGRVHAAELFRFYEMCDVFCMPSVDRREAFGLPLLEAHSLGKPVVCSDIPGSGVREVCIHKQTGLMVRPGDADELALTLRQALADPGLRRILGKEGKRRFEENHRIADIAARLDEVYAGSV